MPWSVELLITEVAAMKNDTVKKLKSMRLPAFAEAYEKQIDQEAEYGSMSFHERLMLLGNLVGLSVFHCKRRPDILPDIKFPVK